MAVKVTALCADGAGVARLTTGAAATILALLTPLSRASEVNLLSNPDFSNQNGVTAWLDPMYPSKNDLSWSSEDADGTVQSGSAQIANNQPYMTDTANAGSRCLAVSPGSDYVYGGKSLVVEGVVTAAFMCQGFSDATCSSDLVELAPDATSGSSAGWSEMSVAEGRLSASTNYVRCMLAVWNNETGTATMRFDDLYFVSTPPDDIFSDDFEMTENDGGE